MPLRILHLEDDPQDQELVASEIKHEGLVADIVPAKTREEFLGALERQKFDLILADFILPKYGGGEAMEAARAIAPETPFIFVSGRMPEEIALQKLRSGATDYVSKSHLTRLGPIVRRILQQAAERSRRKLMEEELAHAAQAAGFGVFAHDLLSGVLVWSAVLKALFGFPSDISVPPAMAEERLHPDDRKIAEKAYNEGLNPVSGGNLEWEFRIIRPDGALRWMLAKGRVIFHETDGIRRPVLASGVVVDITRRKEAEDKLQASEMRVREQYDKTARAQAALKQSEQQLEVVVENLTEGLVIANAEGKLLMWNRAALEMHGFESLSEAQGHLEDFAKLFELRSLDGRVLPLKEWPLSRILRGERVQNLEVCWHRLDTDTHRIVSYGGTMVRSSDNELLAFLTITDITERKHAEDGLRDSEAHLRRVLDNLFAFVAVLDCGCALREVNRAPLEASGLSFQDVVGKKFWDCYWWTYSEEAQTRVRVACEHALAGEVSRFDIPTRVAGGKLIWIDFQISPLRDEQGRITHLVPSAMDISARRAAEQAANESAERFRTLADNMSQLAWMANEKGRPFWFNERWFEYTGTTIEEMLENGWGEVHHPEYLHRVEEKFQKHVVLGEAWEDTFPLRGHDGQYRWFLSRALPIKDATGHVLRWFGTNTDVTERLRAEAALRETDRRKDEFLAMLGHELRNPLSAIRNATMLLKEGANDPANIEWAHAILDRQSVNLSRMVDDLLDVARITRGQVELRKVVVHLGQIARSAADAVKQLVQNKNHQLELHIEGRVGPPVLGDAARLEQVVVNLLTNAIKYTPPGGRICMETYEDDQEAVLTVRDTGIGMPASLLPDIFELFTQGDRSLDRAEGGLGIGLNLCRQLVTMHGGVIQAKSAGVGAGSEFTVRLPRHTSVAHAVNNVEVPPPEPVVPVAPSTPVGKRVLVVDDNTDTARSLARLLSRRGYEVSVAHDGPSGERAAHEFEPEVCLLDIGLPGFDGYELARRLRASGPCQEALMIAISGYAQEGDRQRSRVSGFDAHFAKPVDLDKLFEHMAAAQA